MTTQLRTCGSLSMLLIVWSLAGCANGPHEAEVEGVVRNGSFESPAADAPYVRMAPGLPLDGWTIAGGPIDLIGDYWRAADGRQSVHIAHGGSISQDVLTKSGRTYELRFAAAANASHDGSNPLKHLNVMWGNKLVDTIELDSRMHSRDEMGWRYYAYPVKANGNHTTLKFSCEEEMEWGAALDAVRLVPAAEGTANAVTAK